MDFIAQRTIITKLGNITETKYGKRYEYSADIEATIFFDPSKVHIESK